VFGSARAAGDRARALWLPMEAERWYGAASGLAGVVGADAADRISILRSRIESGLLALSVPDLETIVRSLLDLSVAAGDGLSEGWALTRLSDIAFEHGDDDAMRSNLDAAIATLEPLGDSAELAEAWRIQGWRRWRRGLAEEAEPALRRAVDIAARVDAPVIRAEAADDLAITISMLGRGDEAIAAIEDAYRLAQECGDLNARLRVNNNYPATIETWTSDFARCRMILLEGLELAKKAGARVNIGWIGGSLGDNAMIAGDLREAETYHREAIEGARAVASEPLLGMRLNALSYCLTLQGRLDEADAVYEEAVQLGEANPEPQNELPLRLGGGVRAALRGDLEASVHELELGAQIARRYHEEAFAEGFVHLVRGLIDLGRHDEAATYRDLSLRGRAPYAKAMGRIVDGLLARDADEAVRLIVEGTDELERLGVRAELGRALLDQARARHRAGGDPSADLARAREVLTDCGAFGWLPELERLQADLSDL
jgi:tetratricopeptide (TPR) repeat protein